MENNIHCRHTEMITFVLVIMTESLLRIRGQLGQLYIGGSENITQRN